MTNNYLFRSADFHSFVKISLTKNPRKRPSSEKLLQVLPQSSILLEERNKIASTLIKKLVNSCPQWKNCSVVLWVTDTPHIMFSLQHPFVSQLLTRTLAIELLDMASNPVLQTTHTMDESDLDVSMSPYPILPFPEMYAWAQQYMMWITILLR